MTAQRKRKISFDGQKKLARRGLGTKTGGLGGGVVEAADEDGNENVSWVFLNTAAVRASLPFHEDFAEGSFGY